MSPNDCYLCPRSEHQNEAKGRNGKGPPPGADGAPEGRPASEGRSRWHSVVDHGAIDVAASEGGEVQRDRRFLEGDHRAGGDVEATADAVAVASAFGSQATESQVQEDSVWSRVAEPPVPTKASPPQPLPPSAPETPRPPRATLPISELLLRATDDMSEIPRRKRTGNAAPYLSCQVAEYERDTLPRHRTRLAERG